jgi:putative methyltransferase
MSLYHEAAEVLTSVKSNNGSLKSVVFGKKTWKSDAKTLFALAAEAAKWSSVLSEVVENSGILKLEKNASQLLKIAQICFKMIHKF